MVLLTSIGIRKTLRLITQYPGVLFISMFSFWTIGPVCKSDSKSCCQLFKQEKLGISTKFTWINFMLSMACSVVTSLLIAPYFLLIWIILAPMIIILLITLVSLLHGDSLNNFWCCFKWQYYWCVCCKNCVTSKYSVLNLVTMEEDAEMQEVMNKTKSGCHSRKHCFNCCINLFMVFLIVLLVLSVYFIVFVFIVGWFLITDYLVD